MAIKFPELTEKIKTFVRRHTKLTILIIIFMFGLYTFVSIEILHYTSDPKFCKNCHPLDRHSFWKSNRCNRWD